MLYCLGMYVSVNTLCREFFWLGIDLSSVCSIRTSVVLYCLGMYVSVNTLCREFFWSGIDL